MTVESAPAQALVDVWSLFGLEVAVIAAVLLWSPRDPLRHIALVRVVIGLEVVRRTADDLYLIIRGNDAIIYTAWIVLHLVIAIPGVVLARRAPQVERRPVGQ